MAGQMGRLWKEYLIHSKSYRRSLSRADFPTVHEFQFHHKNLIDFQQIARVRFVVDERKFVNQSTFLFRNGPLTEHCFLQKWGHKLLDRVRFVI